MGDLKEGSSPNDLGTVPKDDLANNECMTNKDECCVVKKSRNSMWSGYYCCVPLCRHSYGEQKVRKQLFNERLSFILFQV